MFSASAIVNNLAFVVAIFAGLGIIFWTVFHDAKRTETANISFGKLKLDLRGRNATQLSIGGLLIVAPALASGIVSPQVTPPSKTFQEVSQIKDPDYGPFVFISDQSVLDLRSSLDEPIGWLRFLTRRKSNPATLTNTMVIQKVSEASGIAFKYATSGKMAVRCLSHPCQIRHAIDTEDDHGAVVLKEVWEVGADIHQIPVGANFTMIVEATYWNAFDTPDKLFFATYANDQTQPETVSLALLFPEDKPYKNFSLFGYDHGKAPQSFSGDSRLVPGEGNRSIFWEVPGAQTGKTYELHWTY